jgi:hypothetical protein
MRWQNASSAPLSEINSINRVYTEFRGAGKMAEVANEHARRP